MPLHQNFPKSPYEIIDPYLRWMPTQDELFQKNYDTLLPPLVAQLRKNVKEWRDNGYPGATDTSKALLNWWFSEEHLYPASDGNMFTFRYYFAQREAVETIIWLYEVAQVKDKFDLLRFDSSGAVSGGMFYENWKRFVIKMATGSGKTKVLSLILAWSYYHKLYEDDSELARNFLIIAPNIIVLDRLRQDFDGLKIFYTDPIIPENGYEGQNWQDDFQMTLHIQDDVNVIKKEGNIFLTNIHRVYESANAEPSFADDDTSDYFLGSKPVASTSESLVDLGDIVRDIDELVVLNDEAHHIHDPSLAWFKSIQDIHNRLLQKGATLSLQVDVTATPRHNNGAIFVQTVSDYPLVEAIYQNVVKHPILPDEESRRKLSEKKSSKYTERYEDYIHLGYLEWKKVYDEHQRLGKKAVLFIMTDDTKNCDEVAEYVQMQYPELNKKVLVIHTKRNGEISEASSGKSKEELEKLRDIANTIDSPDNEYKVIVSVLMLKEGWDVQNVTTIVGLRPYTSQSNILPEQTLGRGLRRMYKGDENAEEYVSVVGTDAFMDFVESIREEGVTLERKPMGEGKDPIAPLIIEVDLENTVKDIKKLDILIPKLTPRLYNDFSVIENLDTSRLTTKTFEVKHFNQDEKREIKFSYIVRKEGEENEVHHVTELSSNFEMNYQSVIGFFAQMIMKEFRMISGYDIIYPKLKEYIKDYLFGKQVDLEDLDVLKTLSELDVTKHIVESFVAELNKLTIKEKIVTEIPEFIKISNTRPFVVNRQPYLIPRLSLFNKIIGDGGLELKFAEFLEECNDIISYAKNYFAIKFKLDYKNSKGGISNYYPDFFVKKTEDEIYIIELKGREELDVPNKLERLKQWCEDVNKLQSKIKYDWLYVNEDKFNLFRARNFEEFIKAFK
jgi:type III restriction enzyme